MAGAFDTWQKCERFVEERVPVETGQELQPFGTKFEWDEGAQPHVFYSSDYEVA